MKENRFSFSSRSIWEAIPQIYKGASSTQQPKIKTKIPYKHYKRDSEVWGTGPFWGCDLM
jgi:hypothetical protein